MVSLRLVLWIMTFFLMINNGMTKSFTHFSWLKKFPQGPKVRILLGKSLDKIFVHGEDITRLSAVSGKKITYQGRKGFQLLCPKNISESQTTSQTTLLTQLTSQGGTLFWNDAPYRGEFYVFKEQRPYCSLVHESPLEDYVSSVLPKEMNAHWPLEVLKAQAIAARTYALAMINNKKHQSSSYVFDLENSEKYQVNGNMSDISTLAMKATEETKGLFLLNKDNKVAPIFYHSKCGGKTLLPRDVWDKTEKDYSSVRCPYCKGHGNKTWTYLLSEIEWEQIIKKYGKKINDQLASNAMAIKVHKKEDRILEIHHQGQSFSLSKHYIRRFLGREKIPSHFFSFYKKEGTWMLEGEGNGHGVGLCQFGALAMADMGQDYRKILSFYFPNHHISKLY
jgi:stage II sporulation protein D